jgi:hypothetical protein
MGNHYEGAAEEIGKGKRQKAKDEILRDIIKIYIQEMAQRAKKKKEFKQTRS